MTATQLTLCYMPILGGQEVYVDQLTRLVERFGNSSIIQAHPRTQLEIQNVTRRKIIMLKIPRGLHRINNILPTIYFRELSKPYLKKIPRDEKIIYHYASLVTKSSHPVENTIVVSHGRDWSDGIFGNYRVYKLLDAYKRGYKIICNDLDVANFIAKKEKINYSFSIEKANYKNIFYIPNSYDSALFEYIDENNFSRDYFILVRNLRKSRGIDFALRAFSTYRLNGGKKSMKIVGGPTKGVYFELLQSLVKNLGIANCVDFLGQKPRHEIPNLYRGAALSIVPSVAFEGTSISALESMAVGCPCASTAVGGLNDLPTFKFFGNDELVFLMNKADNYDRRFISDSVACYSSEEWERKWISVLRG